MASNSEAKHHLLTATSLPLAPERMVTLKSNRITSTAERKKEAEEPLYLMRI